MRRGAESGAEAEADTEADADSDADADPDFLPLWRLAASWLMRAAFAASLFVTAIGLHMPTPSGVGDDAAGDVRGAWTAVGAVARALGRFVPDGIGEALDPVLDDKAIHVAMFLALSFFWAAGRAFRGTLSARVAVVGFFALVAYAAIGEAAQSLEGRIAELGDWVANVIGAALGVGAAMLGRAGYQRATRSTAGAPGPAKAPAPSAPS